jgi:endogenous inhibitor of DNA gyrase (YacG/DUF329 family)
VSRQVECACCGAAITITDRHKNRRFCSPRCRAAHWRHQHHHHLVDDVHDVANAVIPANAVTNGVNGVAAANGIQRCPHCGGELAVINVLVPAAAAHIQPPSTTPTAGQNYCAGL